MSVRLVSVDTTLEALIEDDFVPAISPTGFRRDNYEPYNINADDMKCSCGTLKRRKIGYL